MKKIVVLVLICIVSNGILNAQQWNRGSGGSGEQFAFSVGTNIVYDAGDLGKILDGEALNLKNPIYINFQYYLSSEFSLLTSFSLNAYDVGKLIDGEIVSDGNKNAYTSFDFSVRYSLMESINIYPFEPFIEVGAAYTTISTGSAVMVNCGGGLNYWINDKFAISTNAIAKLKTNDALSNKIQFNAGVIFKINNY